MTFQEIKERVRLDPIKSKYQLVTQNPYGNKLSSKSLGYKKLPNVVFTENDETSINPLSSETLIRNSKTFYQFSGRFESQPKVLPESSERRQSKPRRSTGNQSLLDVPQEHIGGSSVTSDQTRIPRDVKGLMEFSISKGPDSKSLVEYGIPEIPDSKSPARDRQHFAERHKRLLPLIRRRSNHAKYHRSGFRKSRHKRKYKHNQSSHSLFDKVFAEEAKEVPAVFQNSGPRENRSKLSYDSKCKMKDCRQHQENSLSKNTVLDLSQTDSFHSSISRGREKPSFPGISKQNIWVDDFDYRNVTSQVQNPTYVPYFDKHDSKYERSDDLDKQHYYYEQNSISDQTKENLLLENYSKHQVEQNKLNDFNQHRNSPQQNGYDRQKISYHHVSNVDLQISSHQINPYEEQFDRHEHQSGVRVLAVDVPHYVEVGDDALLECHFDLAHLQLYSLKWYRDDDEFFRFMPSEDPAKVVLPVPGVRVKVSYSTV